MEVIVKNEKEMMELGEKIAWAGASVIELVGDVGAGKTTLARGLARGLGVQEEVTSPSFTISKSYTGKDKILVHYDFYRLNEPGLLAEDLAEDLENPEAVVVLEWAETVSGILPEERMKVVITLNDDGTRTVEVPEGVV